MKIITCASYHGTGSSAVTDLLTEYKNVTSLGDYEFPFLYATDGVADLEYHLTQFPDRHASGHALKRFERLVNFNSGKWFNARYEPFFNNKYKELSYKYINQLLVLKNKCSYFYDDYDRGVFFYYAKGIMRKIFQKLHLYKLVSGTTYEYFCNVDYDDFLKYTQEYTHSLMEAANTNNSEFLIIDQLMPSSNTMHCLKYMVDDVKVFIIDRDPRDVYLNNKYGWREVGVPTDAHDFCKWFRSSHKCSDTNSYDNDKIIKLNFEDIIYNYNDTVRRIEKLCGFKEEDHQNQFSKLNPKRSVNNTRLWEKYEDKKAMEVIETELKEYLYPYEQLTSLEVPGIECSNKSIF